MKTKLFTLLMFVSSVPLFAGSDDSRIKVEIRDPELRLVLISLLDSVQVGDGTKVWDLGDASWKKFLRDAGYKEGLKDFKDELSKSQSILVDYEEVRKFGGADIAYFSIAVRAGNERATFDYRAHIIFKKTTEGWRFLNMPFKDFIMPFPAALLSTRDQK